MNRKLALLPILLAVLLIIGRSLPTSAQTPIVAPQVRGGGGGHIEQGNITLDNTIGQPVVGTAKTITSELCSGFWCGVLAQIEPPAPIADFTAAPREGVAPLSVTFTDTSTYTPTAWLWSLGDGATITTQHPIYTYTIPGHYTVTFTVSNSHGSDVLTRPNYITVTAPSCVPVTDVTIYGATAGQVDTPYVFTTTTAPLSATIPLTYTWAPAPDAGQDTATVTYTWSATGTQMIVATARNCDGAGFAQDVHTVTIQAPLEIVPLTAITIHGPITGQLNTAYLFTTTIAPVDATMPITYIWDPAPVIGQGETTVAYTWATTGTKFITITARNGAGTSAVTDVHTITIQAALTETVSVTNVTIYGPTNGQVDTAYVFTTTTAPLDATTPITYTWTPAPDVGQGTDTATYTWLTSGTKFITVTARNGDGTKAVTDVHTVTIETASPEVVSVTAVTIHGPTSGQVDTAYVFTTTTAPLDATTPITYTWTPAPDVGQGTDTATYTWLTSGTKFITVTTRNGDGTSAASDVHTVTIETASPEIISVTNVTIYGPTNGQVDTAYVFTTTTAPPGATTPITYTWTPIPDAGQGTDTATYTWLTSGTKFITVAAKNVAGSATDTHEVVIESLNAYRVFLPLILKLSN